MRLEREGTGFARTLYEAILSSLELILLGKWELPERI